MNVSKFFLAASAAAGLAMAAGTASAGQITTEKEFRAAIVDRTLSFSKGTEITFYANGRWKGGNAEAKGKGKWYWEGALMCRTGKWAKKKLALDCQEFHVDGSEVTYVRERGQGKAVTGTIN